MNLNNAIPALLSWAGLENMWNEEERRPTEKAWRCLDGDGTLSSGELIMLQVAVDLWNGHGGARLGRVVNVLDQDNLYVVGTLLTAISQGQDAVDTWVTMMSGREAFRLDQRVNGPDTRQPADPGGRR